MDFANYQRTLHLLPSTKSLYFIDEHFHMRLCVRTVNVQTTPTLL